MDRTVPGFCTYIFRLKVPSLSWLGSLRALLCGCLILCLSCSVLAKDPPSPPSSDYSTLDLEVRTLKKEVLAVNRELRLLEEEMLYPSEQQLVMLLSVLNQPGLKLDQISITLDGAVLVEHNYSAAENAALAKGGTHRPYMGKLKRGGYQLTVSLSGVNGDGSSFKQRVRQPVEKQLATRYIELRVEPAWFAGSPLLSIHQW